MNAIQVLDGALKDACWAECRAVGAAEHEAAGKERDVYFAALAAVDALHQAAKAAEFAMDELVAWIDTNIIGCREVEARGEKARLALAAAVRRVEA